MGGRRGVCIPEKKKRSPESDTFNAGWVLLRLTNFILAVALLFSEPIQECHDPESD